jgi:hypothetical protein
LSDSSSGSPNHGSAKSERSRINRNTKRAAYDRKTVNAILDAGYLCHVAFETDQKP